MNQYSVKIQDHTVKFNKEATRWLGIFLDIGLSLKEYYQIRF